MKKLFFRLLEKTIKYLEYWSKGVVINELEFSLYYPSRDDVLKKIDELLKEQKVDRISHLEPHIDWYLTLPIIENDIYSTSHSDKPPLENFAELVIAKLGEFKFKKYNGPYTVKIITLLWNQWDYLISVLIPGTDFLIETDLKSFSGKHFRGVFILFPMYMLLRPLIVNRESFCADIKKVYRYGIVAGGKSRVNVMVDIAARVIGGRMIFSGKESEVIILAILEYAKLSTTEG